MTHWTDYAPPHARHEGHFALRQLYVSIERRRIQVRVERARLLIEHFLKEHPMAGEIRDKLNQLRQAHAKMVTGISAEIDAVIKEVGQMHADGLEAAQLPRAEMQKYRDEIQEIRSEFAGLTNGAPPGPLPGSEPDVKPLPPSSADSAQNAQSALNGSYPVENASAALNTNSAQKKTPA